MNDVLKLTNEKVDEVINLVEENLLPIPNDELREYWNKIEFHYIHYTETYHDGLNPLDKNNSDNIINGCNKHLEIINEIIQKRQK